MFNNNWNWLRDCAWPQQGVSQLVSSGDRPWLHSAEILWSARLVQDVVVILTNLLPALVCNVLLKTFTKGIQGLAVEEEKKLEQIFVW